MPEIQSSRSPCLGYWPTPGCWWGKQWENMLERCLKTGLRIILPILWQCIETNEHANIETKKGPLDEQIQPEGSKKWKIQGLVCRRVQRWGKNIKNQKANQAPQTNSMSYTEIRQEQPAIYDRTPLLAPPSTSPRPQNEMTFEGPIPCLILNTIRDQTWNRIFEYSVNSLMS